MVQLDGAALHSVRCLQRALMQVAATAASGDNASSPACIRFGGIQLPICTAGEDITPSTQHNLGAFLQHFLELDEAVMQLTRVLI
jgi:hypothetical protein